MFSREHWQIKLAYAGFGALLLFIGMLLSPVTAHRDKFGAIECTKLTVVDADGKTRVIISSNNEHGGSVAAYSKDGQSRAALAVTEHEGSVSAFGKDGQLGAWLRADEHGGRVQVKGKGEGKAVIGINEYGNGAVSTWDKNGYRQ